MVTGTPSIQDNATTLLWASIIGSTENWAVANNRVVKAGSFFDGDQSREAARVVVVGPDVADTLFGSASAALGQTFQIIGVMQSYGHQSDNTAIMPLSTVRRYVVGPASGIGDQVNQIILIITLFVPAVAGISLLVGGIGVLNIMLASVGSSVSAPESGCLCSSALSHRPWPPPPASSPGSPPCCLSCRWRGPSGSAS